MLRRFPEAYRGTAGQSGPNIPAEGSPNQEQYFRNAIKAVVGDNETAVDLYMNYDEMKELSPWYRYLFLSRSKPSTHLQALADIGNDELKTKAPPPLERLLQQCDMGLSV